MSEPLSPQEMSAFYQKRHALRQGLYDDRGYANYGYWPQPGMSVVEACKAMTDLIATELSLGPKDRLLEVGCGYGESAVQIAREYAPARILGVDVTALRLAHAWGLVRENQLEDRVWIGFANAVHLALHDSSIDKVMAIECAFHFDTRQAFLEEVSRVIRPGGILAMTDVIPAAELDLSQYEVSEIRDFLAPDARRYPHVNVYGADTYRKYLEQAGFHSIEIRSIKDQVVLPFADYLERAAHESDPEKKDRRLRAADRFRNKLQVGGDYVLVKATRR